MGEEFTCFGMPQSSDKTCTGIGTSYYMAPECARGSGVYGEGVDIFSFGILSMEVLLERMCPFPGMNAASGFSMLGVQGRTAMDPSFRPNVDELGEEYQFLSWVLRACWDSESDKRPPFRDIAKILKLSLYEE